MDERNFRMNTHHPMAPARHPLARLTLPALWLLAVVLLLPGCFSGGTTEPTLADGGSSSGTGTDSGGSSGGTASGGAGSAGGTTSGSGQQLTLLADRLQLPSGESGSVRITANVKDANNVLVAGQAVSFQASSGSLQVVQATTDTLGNAVAILSSPHDPINRPITVTASAGQASATLTIQVSGTRLEILGPATPITTGGSADLTFKLQAGDGSVLANQPLTVQSERGNPLTDADGNPLANGTVTTNSQGEAVVRVTDGSGQDDTISASAFGGKVQASPFTLRVSPNSLAFETPAAGSEIPLGSDQTVTVRLVRGGSPAVGETVSFSTTRGLFAGGAPTADAVTDADGRASVTLHSNFAGGATITASTGDETATHGVEFVATVPASVSLTASPEIVGPQEHSTLTATVRDANNNLVKNSTVVFNLLQDITQGTLSVGEVTTDSFGRASTVYTAGVQASGKDGVQVRADVKGSTPLVTTTTRLTVEPQDLRIVFGTGNEMFEPNPAQYRQPYVIQVSDDGVPVAGARVELLAYPVQYYKGRYVATDTDGSGQPDTWVPVWSATCAAEDSNRNGVLDDGEVDLNGDGLPTPPAVVTIGADSAQSPTVSHATVTTDANGFAYFSLYYPQDHANWIRVELVAQTTQAGQGSRYTTQVVPPALADDVNDVKKAPPGGSPFGQSSNCTDTL